jgi:pimeloyl-ACP methyl ester carboxylesterase
LYGDEVAVLAAVGEKMVTVDGLRLRCQEAGDGPAVVLVHGIATSLEYWRFTVGALAACHRVLAIDLPGCGFSERGAVLPTLPETADLLVGLLDALGIERASFVGNSLGGLICLETVLRHPERTARLILSNSAGLGREINPLWRVVAIPPVGRVLIAANCHAARRGWYNLFYHPRSEPEVAIRYREWVGRPDLADTLLGVIRGGIGLRGQKAEILRVDRLPRLAAPTLVVWGRRDPIIPVAHGIRAHRLIPNARLAILENCGHCPQLEAPLEFNRLARDFLDEGVGC